MLDGDPYRLYDSRIAKDDDEKTRERGEEMMARNRDALRETGVYWRLRR